MDIELTATAIEQIRRAQEQGDFDGSALRIAARTAADGSIEYVMGFDEIDGRDTLVTVGQVCIAVDPSSVALLNGMTMDFVEIEPGQTHFIFLNPNDPHYVAPKT